MKQRSIKHIFSFLLAMLLILSLSMTAFAAGASVSYEGGAEKFVFLPGSEYTDTDLFDNFKGVMPGDTIQQKITVKNNYRGCDYVKIYMRAEVHDEIINPLNPNVSKTGETVVSMKDFLSHLSMTVTWKDTVIFEGSPDELNGLKENVLLGSFKYGDHADLKVDLHVPIELGNEYANRVGEVDWVFVVEEYDGPLPPGPRPPQTGDSTMIWPYFILMGMSVCGMIILLISKKKNEKN